MLIGGIVLSGVWLFTGRRQSLSRRVWLALVCAAVFFALDLWFWHRSIVYVGAGLATLLANLQVFFMIAAGVALAGQPPTARQAAAAVLALGGLSIMIGPEWTDPPPAFRVGVVLGVLTAASYAGYMLSMRAARLQAVDIAPVREVAVVSLLTAVLLGIASCADGSSLKVTTWSDLSWLMAYGVLAHSFGVMLITSSLAKVSTTQVGIALLLQPALSFVWEVLFFARVTSQWEAVGVAITLGAIFLGSTKSLRVSRSQFGIGKPRL